MTLKTKITFSGLSSALTLLLALAVAQAPEAAYQVARSAVETLFSTSQKLEAFGRTWMPRERFPYSAIGQVISPVDLSHSVLCSGALISACHVLTAKHCIDRSAHAYFAHDSKTYSRARVVAQGASSDWAILELSEHMGTKLGWMSLAPKPLDVHGRTFEFAGLPHAITSLAPSLKTGIRDVDTQYDDLEKDTKLWTATRLAHGDSGGALWTRINGRPVIVGNAVRALVFRDGSYFFPTSEAAAALANLSCGARP